MIPFSLEEPGQEELDAAREMLKEPQKLPDDDVRVRAIATLLKTLRELLKENT